LREKLRAGVNQLTPVRGARRYLQIQERSISLRMLVMRTRQSMGLRWIEEADARKLCELAFAERQPPLPEVSSVLRRRLTLLGSTLRSALFDRSPKRRDCRC
jgi:hypothetical protein